MRVRTLLNANPTVRLMRACALKGTFKFTLIAGKILLPTPKGIIFTSAPSGLNPLPFHVVEAPPTLRRRQVPCTLRQGPGTGKSSPTNCPAAKYILGDDETTTE